MLIILIIFTFSVFTLIFSKFYVFLCHLYIYSIIKFLFISFSYFSASALNEKEKSKYSRINK